MLRVLASWLWDGGVGLSEYRILRTIVVRVEIVTELNRREIAQLVDRQVLTTLASIAVAPNGSKIRKSRQPPPFEVLAAAPQDHPACKDCSNNLQKWEAVTNRKLRDHAFLIQLDLSTSLEQAFTRRYMSKLPMRLRLPHSEQTVDQGSMLTSIVLSAQ